jgi:hypothetical protein
MPCDDGRLPQLLTHQQNAWMLDPQGINNLEQVVEIEGLLNCKVSHAINVIAPEAAIKRAP